MIVTIQFNDGTPDEVHENVSSFVIQNGRLVLQPAVSDIGTDLSAENIEQVTGF